MVIDAHQHFWRYTDQEFGWIGDAMANLRRDFLPADLKREMAASDVSAVVSVQARQTERETEWLLDLAAEHQWICGVIGWVPLVAEDLSDRLARYQSHRKLVGVRHVVQGEPDGFLARADFNRGVKMLRAFGLVYDLLIVERQLPETIAFVDRHPAQVFVLDHLAKPRIDTGEMEPWGSNLRELARRENVWCKVSGGITEADLRWTPAKLRPYLDAALESFGPRRLMFGSNWPVTEAAGGYHAWLDAVRSWAAPLSDDEQRWLFAESAISAYKLKVTT
jgi:L-fuconolactonase